MEKKRKKNKETTEEGKTFNLSSGEEKNSLQRGGTDRSVSRTEGAHSGGKVGGDRGEEVSLPKKRKGDVHSS